MADPPVRVLHVITGLARAGAEMVLYRLLEHGDPQRVENVAVVSLTGEGPLAGPVRELGVPLVLLDIRSPVGVPRALLRLRRIIRDAAPDVVQTWMYHGDLLGGIAARAAGVRHVVWGLHASTRAEGGPRASARLGVSASARLSHHLPERIIACAESARDVHIGLGYDASKMVVIPNGFEQSTADEGAGAAVRAALGIPADSRVLLRLARYHPQKDYDTLLRACGIVARLHPDLWLLLAGLDVTAQNVDLLRRLDEQDLTGRTVLLGLRDDPQRLLAAADVLISSSSYGEAHPLVVGEAMAARVPVVTTDVGDSAALLGPDAGRVVAPGSPAALAAAIDDLLRMTPAQRRDMGRAGADRVASMYGLERMVKRYQDVYLDAVHHVRAPS
jgi:glycosyltransferase involved in cell wall biosynthesis